MKISEHVLVWCICGPSPNFIERKASYLPRNHIIDKTCVIHSHRQYIICNESLRDPNGCMYHHCMSHVRDGLD